MPVVQKGISRWAQRRSAQRARLGFKIRTGGKGILPSYCIPDRTQEFVSNDHQQLPEEHTLVPANVSITSPPVSTSVSSNIDGSVRPSEEGDNPYRREVTTGPITTEDDLAMGLHLPAALQEGEHSHVSDEEEAFIQAFPPIVDGMEVDGNLLTGPVFTGVHHVLEGGNAAFSVPHEHERIGRGYPINAAEEHQLPNHAQSRIRAASPESDHTSGDDEQGPQSPQPVGPGAVYPHHINAQDLDPYDSDGDSSDSDLSDTDEEPNPNDPHPDDPDPDPGDPDPDDPDPDDPDPDDPDPDDPEPDDPDEEEEDEVDSDEDGAPVLSLDAPQLLDPLVYARPTTVRAALAVFLTKAIRHNLSYEALLADMSSFNVLHSNAQLPSHKHALWRVLARNMRFCHHHAYCRDCLAYIGIKSRDVNRYECPQCHAVKNRKHVSYFSNLNLRQQLKRLLQLPGMQHLLQYRDTRQQPVPGTMSDIYDGAEYQRLRQPGGFLSNPYNLSFTIFADGFKVHSTSSVSAWVVYLTVNELPPKLRRKHMILAAVWVCKKHPDMNLFLRPVVEELNRLYRIGVSWTNEDGVILRSCFCCIVLCADIPARCSMLNMSSFTTDYGCTFCLIRGVNYDMHGVYLGSMKYPAMEVELPRRTHEAIEAAMEAALNAEDDEPVLGAKGPSQIMEVDGFNAEKAQVADPMHNRFLGLAEQHMTHITKGEHELARFYIGRPNTIQAIDNRILTLKRPSIIGRGPRLFSERNQWTAAEWRSWLLYYGVPCLMGILPEPYLNHFSLLSHAVFLSSTEEVTQADVREVKRLTREYAHRCQQYFGIRYMSYNLHIFGHGVEDLVNWGPDWTHTAFDFERLNYDMKKFLKGPTKSGEQIVMRYFMSRFVQETVDRANIPPAVQLWIRNQLYGEAGFKETVTVEGMAFKGWGHVRFPNMNEQQALGRKGLHCQDMMRTYRGAALNGVLYCRRVEGAADRTDDSVLFFLDGEVGVIEQAVWFELNGQRKSGFFVKMYEQVQHLASARHIIQCIPTENLTFVQPHDVQSPAVRSIIANMHYLAPLPNLVEMH